MNTRTAGSEMPLRIIAIDNMRDRSHLFWRWFSTLPGFVPRLHPYVMAAMFGPEGWLRDFHVNEARAKHIAEVEKVAPHESLQACLENVKRWTADAEKANESLFFSEHAMFLMKADNLLAMTRKGDAAYEVPQYNPSHLPESLLSTFTSVFIIRHPALSIPSLWRHVSRETPTVPQDEDVDVFTSLRFSRALLDFLRMMNGKAPLVIDGEDILWRTEELGNNLCKALGIDVARPTDVWQPRTQDVRPKEWWIWSLTKTMHESTGIIRPSVKTEKPDLETQFSKWKQEFGNEIATSLHKLAVQNMPHYEYLTQFAI